MEDNNSLHNNQLSGETDGGDETLLTKRHKPPPDRLSDLPGLALAHILSGLHIEEAARTSVLSKRFKSLWKSVAVLSFSDESSGKVGENFISFVDHVLRRHERQTIEKFSVKFLYDFIYKSSVDEWIKFAAEKEMKSLSLNFYQRSCIDILQLVGFEHVLPKFLYDNDNLVELITRHCKFSAEGLINLKSLKLLSLARTKLNGELISRVLCGCPVLETMELREWSGIDKLKIESVSLKVLRVVDELLPEYLLYPGEECSLEISGPNLVTLEVSGALYRTKLHLSDLGCLANAAMEFEIKNQSSRIRSVVRDQVIVREVLESLCFVKTLSLGGWCIKTASTCEAYTLSSPWSDRQSLTLCIPLIEWDHLGLASLIHSSPSLETLAIKLSYCSVCPLEHDLQNDYGGGYYCKPWSTISSCPLQHLKTVKVVGLQESCRSMKPLFQFLEFLLRNSSVLEEIVIQASRFLTKVTIDEALKLLDVPTASPDAVLHFKPPHLWVDPLSIYQKSAPM